MPGAALQTYRSYGAGDYAVETRQWKPWPTPQPDLEIDDHGAVETRQWNPSRPNNLI